MVFELIPAEMRFPSVITILLFAIAVGISTPILYLIIRRLSNVETIVNARCIDIEKLAIIAANLEKTVVGFKDDNQRTIEWIRKETDERDKRMEKNIAEIHRKLYRGD